MKEAFKGNDILRIVSRIYICRKKADRIFYDRSKLENDARIPEQVALKISQQPRPE